MGLCRAAAYLEKAGHETKVLDGQATSTGPDDTLNSAISMEPDVVLIQTVPETHLYTFMTVSGFPYHIEFARRLKTALPGVIIIMGGAYTTYAADRILKDEPCVDAIFGGWPAKLPDVIASYRNPGRLKDIPGVSIIYNHTLYAPTGREKAQEKLLSPAFHLLEGYPGRYGVDENLYLGPTRKIKPVQPAIGSLGCPYSCNFCTTPLYFQNKYSERSLDDFLLEIEFLIERYGITDFSIWDDTFTISRKRVETFCRMLINRGIHLKWWCFGHAVWVKQNADLLPLLREAGLRMMWIGVEAADNKVLSAYCKRMSFQDGKDAIRLLCGSDILPTASYILGNIDDTDDSLREVIDISMEFVEMGTVNVYTILIPVPGTPIYDRAQKNGLLYTNDLRLYNGARAVINYPHFDREKVEEYFFTSYRKSILNERFLKNPDRVNFRSSGEGDFKRDKEDNLSELYKIEVERMLSLEKQIYFKDTNPDNVLWKLY